MRHSSTRSLRDSQSDTLSAYLREIGSYPLLSQEQEVELAQRAAAGDKPSLDRLVCSNLRFVVSVAKKYQNQGVTLADLINEGNLGLVRAAERFDGAKGVKFISYAVWYIRRAIFQAIADHGRPVRVPLGRLGDVHRIRRRTNALRQELGRDPTQHEVAEYMQIPEDDVEVSIRVSHDSLSLDDPPGIGETGKLGDYLPADPAAETEVEAADLALASSVQHALTALRQRDADVLRLYFGFDAIDPMTLEDIGSRLGITRERVRQIKERALSRLRKSADAQLLASLAP
jgi:RNA polymerase primary sigma factor